MKRVFERFWVTVVRDRKQLEPTQSLRYAGLAAMQMVMVEGTSGTSQATGAVSVCVATRGRRHLESCRSAQ